MKLTSLIHLVGTKDTTLAPPSCTYIWTTNYVFHFSDVVRGHTLSAEAQRVPELQPVHRDCQGDLVPRVGDVPVVAHDHRAEEPAYKLDGDQYFGREGNMYVTVGRKKPALACLIMGLHRC